MSKSAGSQAKPEGIGAPPRQALQLGVSVGFCFWLFPAAVLAVVIFVLSIRLLKLPGWMVLCAGVVLAGVLFLTEAWIRHFHLPLMELVRIGARMNAVFFKTLLFQGFAAALAFVVQDALAYVLGLSVLMAGLLAMLELIPMSAHEQALKALQQGRASGAVSEVKARNLERSLARLDERDFEGTVLGVSKTTNRPIIMPDASVNQLVLVLGTTGGGKTITLRRFYQRAMRQGYPLIIVDGKPSEETVSWLETRAAQYHSPFYGFNSGNYWHYDPLASGGYTELKDKIISLKDHWESDYYRSIAEDYLQTTLEVLLSRGEPYDLKHIVEALDYDHLALLVRQLSGEKAQRLGARVNRLANYDKKDITGLQAHLSLLIHSELGEYFENVPGKTFSLREVIAARGVVYFALPALRFPSFSSVLGKLIINDMKAVIDHGAAKKPIFTVFDEFSVFAGEQVLNLVNMGRGKGVHAIFGTQGVSDLKKITPEFANQVLNCVNTLICHRLNDQDSAEAVASWAGTRDTFDVTAQISGQPGGTGMGSVRRNKEFIVHPDAIKQDLQPGEAFFISKVGAFKPDKIKVKYS